MRFPPRLNCVPLISRNVVPHSSFTFSKSMILRDLAFSIALAGNVIETLVASVGEREVEARKTSRSLPSSKSQMPTDNTSKVSDMRFAAAAQRLESSIALEVDWAKAVQIWRKSYCGLLKCWLTKYLTFCRKRS